MSVILSREEGWAQFGDLFSEDFLAEVRSEILAHSRSYSIPPEAERRTFLARTLTELTCGVSVEFVVITGWGQGEQNMELFDAYRRSLGERRPVWEASIHLFSLADCRQLECILDLILYFCWDCFLFDNRLQHLIKLSHDGYVNVSCSDAEALGVMSLPLDLYVN